MLFLISPNELGVKTNDWLEMFNFQGRGKKKRNIIIKPNIEFLFCLSDTCHRVVRW